MPKVIVPVGFDNGSRYSMNSVAGDEPEYFEIVNHSRGATLPKDAYSVWLSCFVVPQEHIDLTFNRERLIQLAAREGFDATDTVRRLINTGVLIEYETGTESALEMLRNHQLFACAEGMGSTDEMPALFQIGKLGKILLEVRSEVYHFWSSSFSRPTLWDAVASYSKHRHADAPFSTPEELGYMLAESIPMLVGARCAHLQPVS